MASRMLYVSVCVLAIISVLPSSISATPRSLSSMVDSAEINNPGGSVRSSLASEIQMQNLNASASNSTTGSGRRQLGYYGDGSGGCATGNPIDDCWRCDPNWEANRKKLADCAIGFGRDAIGGRDGDFYVVTDASDDDPVTPKPGTLRHAVIQSEPLWIIFASDMSIQLKEELIMNSYKTIDGRGHEVHISNGPCITVQYVSNIIIHGIHVHDCKPAGNAMVRSSPTHYGWRTISDGDGISIFGAHDIWVDHCSLARCTDGLVDAIMASTAITVSNSFFTQHDKVMLLGHSDDYVADKSMQVTIAFNHFGEELIQRMPRCRHGFFEVVNNDYTHWEMYAIGGSAAPTINSKGNRYTAPGNSFAKSVSIADSPISVDSVSTICFSARMHTHEKTPVECVLRCGDTLLEGFCSCSAVGSLRALVTASVKKLLLGIVSEQRGALESRKRRLLRQSFG